MKHEHSRHPIFAFQAAVSGGGGVDFLSILFFPGLFYRRSACFLSQLGRNWMHSILVRLSCTKAMGLSFQKDSWDFVPCAVSARMDLSSLLVPCLGLSFHWGTRKTPQIQFWGVQSVLRPSSKPTPPTPEPCNGLRLVVFTTFEMLMATLSSLGLLYGAPTTIFVVFKSSKAVPRNCSMACCPLDLWANNFSSQPHKRWSTFYPKSNPEDTRGQSPLGLQVALEGLWGPHELHYGYSKRVEHGELGC